MDQEDGGSDGLPHEDQTEEEEENAMDVGDVVVTVSNGSCLSYRTPTGRRSNRPCSSRHRGLCHGGRRGWKRDVRHWGFILSLQVQTRASSLVRGGWGRERGDRAPVKLSTAI